MSTGSSLSTSCSVSTMSHNSNHSSSSNAVVTSIGPHDVLLGRGAGPNEHSGNVAFRMIIAKFKGRYVATTNRRMKNKIAQDAVNTIRSNDGRFLQKVSGEQDVYRVSDQATVLEKTKQALRHIERPKRRSLNPAAAGHAAPSAAATCVSAPAAPMLPQHQGLQLQNLLSLFGPTESQKLHPAPDTMAPPATSLLASLLAKPVAAAPQPSNPSTDSNSNLALSAILALVLEVQKQRTAEEALSQLLQQHSVPEHSVARHPPAPEATQTLLAALLLQSNTQ